MTWIETKIAFLLIKQNGRVITLKQKKEKLSARLKETKRDLKSEIMQKKRKKIEDVQGSRCTKWLGKVKNVTELS